MPDIRNAGQDYRLEGLCPTAAPFKVLHPDLCEEIQEYLVIGRLIDFIDQHYQRFIR